MSNDSGVYRSLPLPYGPLRPIPDDLKRFVHLSSEQKELLYSIGRQVRFILKIKLIIPCCVIGLGILIIVGAMALIASNTLPDELVASVRVGGLALGVTTVIIGIITARVIWHFWNGTVTIATSHGVRIIVALPNWMTWFKAEFEDGIPSEQISNASIKRRRWHKWFKTGVVRVDGAGTEDARFHNMSWYENGEELKEVGSYFAKRRVGEDANETNKEILLVLTDIRSTLANNTNASDDVLNAATTALDAVSSQLNPGDDTAEIDVIADNTPGP